MSYEKIKSYEDACSDQGRDPSNRPDVSKLEPGLAKFVNAAFELAVITRSLNKNENGVVVKANWNDRNDYKHFPWWDVQADKKNPSGSGLSLYGVACGGSDARVASRLTTREEEASEYSAETFPGLWKDYILDIED